MIRGDEPTATSGEPVAFEPTIARILQRFEATTARPFRAEGGCAGDPRDVLGPGNGQLALEGRQVRLRVP